LLSVSDQTPDLFCSHAISAWQTRRAPPNCNLATTSR
jgi:hypothetical protein